MALTHRITAGILLSVGWLLQPTCAQSTVDTTRQLIAAATDDFNAKKPEAAYIGIGPVLDDPEFATLDPNLQHAALSVGYRAGAATHHQREVYEWAVRATAMPQQNADDWRYRLYGASALGEARDEALCVETIAARWAGNSALLPADVVGRAFLHNRSSELRDARLRMLSALYDAHWTPSDGSSGSYLWRDFSLLLLEDHEQSKAFQVVTRIDEAKDVIVMHADLRYRPLLKAPFFDSDAKQVAERRIAVLRDQAQRQTRSLAVQVRLLQHLLDFKFDNEVIARAEQIQKNIAAGSAEFPAYDDIEKQLPWVLDQQSEALHDLGRFDAGIAVLKSAATSASPVDPVSLAINLASRLCTLDRASEAAQVLPKDSRASEFGLMQVQKVTLTIAVESGDAEAAKAALAYLREHRSASMATLQEALVRAGELDEAAMLLLARLSDPTERTAALMEVQTYADRARTPREQEWHARSEQLYVRPAVRKAIASVGQTDRYLWRYQ